MSAVPSRDTFASLTRTFVSGLHHTKQSKALVTPKLYAEILEVLHNPSRTSNGTAQFRYWVRERFRLDEQNVVRYHWRGKGKSPDRGPADTLRRVVTEDEMYDCILEAHEAIGHLGRDRTYTKVQKRNACVPKELVAAFVRACPTCRRKREENNIASGPRKARRSPKADSAATTTVSHEPAPGADSAFGPHRTQKTHKSASSSPFSHDFHPIKRGALPVAGAAEPTLHEDQAKKHGNALPSPPPSADSQSDFSRSPSPDEPDSLSSASSTYSTSSTSSSINSPPSPPLPFSFPWPKPSPASYSFLRPSSSTTLRTSSASSHTFSAFSPLDDTPTKPAFPFLPSTDRSSPSFRGSETGCEFSFPSSPIPWYSSNWEELEDLRRREEASPFKPSSKGGRYTTLAPAWSWSY